MKNVKLSIITVNFKVEKELTECIKSIEVNFKKISYEIIVVENNHKSDISQKLKQFKNLTYIKSKKNNGFGGGCNLGAKNAKGEFLFFLNPDTMIKGGSVLKLLDLFKKENTGIVAPLLLDKYNKPFERQGTLRLTPIRALASTSLFSRIFPNNPVANKYWIKGWGKKTTKEVDVIPGTAFIIPHLLFEKIKGFDEGFFLYFEESDLCNRVKRLGYRIYISPKLKVMHLWGQSTKKHAKSVDFFKKSRRYYFKKNYGLLGYFTDIILGLKIKETIFIGIILVIAGFLRLYKLSSLMQFIPDMGWFYLSARDLILSHEVPLLGISTSHPWLHHGPIWTYTLSFLLLISNFNPVFPAYFMAILGVTTVLMLFYTVREMFGIKVAYVSTLLYSTSPLIIMNSRLAYHTSPLPLFVILLFFLTFKWIKGNVWFFPLITFVLGILYNHQITSFVFFISVIIIFIYGVIKKKKYATGIINRKIISAAATCFLIPMMPFILYDFSNGFPQTLGFITWGFYRIIKLPLSIIDPFYMSSGSNPSTFTEFILNYKYLVFQQSPNLVFGLSVIAVIFTFFKLREFRKKNRLEISYSILFLFTIISLISLFIHRIPIEADILLISPLIIILISVAINWIFSKAFMLVLFITFFIASGNLYFLLSTQFQTVNGGKITITDQLNAVEKIIYISKGKSYTIKGRGELSDFPVFTMPYEYLLWWKGRPITLDSNNKIIIWQSSKGIKVYKEK